MEAAWRRHLEPDPAGRARRGVAAAGRRAAAPRPVQRLGRPPGRRLVRRGDRRRAAASGRRCSPRRGPAARSTSRGSPSSRWRCPAGAEARVAAQVAHADARLGEAVEAALPPRRRRDRGGARRVRPHDRRPRHGGGRRPGVGSRPPVPSHVLLQLAAQTPDDAASRPRSRASPTAAGSSIASTAPARRRQRALAASTAAAGRRQRRRAASTASRRAAATVPVASTASRRAAQGGGQGGGNGRRQRRRPAAPAAPKATGTARRPDADPRRPVATATPEPPPRRRSRGARRRPAPDGAAAPRDAAPDAARRSAPRRPPGAPVTAALRSPDEDPMRLTVLGAGPAYTDREGSTGACYLVRARTGPTSCSTSARARSRGSSATSAPEDRRRGRRSATSTRTTSSTSCRCATTCATSSSRRGSVRVLGPADLARRLDALHAQPGFTAEALEASTLGTGPPPDRRASRSRRASSRTPTRATRSGSRPDAGRPGPRLQRRLRPGRRPRAADPAGRRAARRGVVRAGPGAPGRAAPRRAGGRAAGAATRAGRVLLTHLQMGHDPEATIASVPRAPTTGRSSSSGRETSSTSEPAAAALDGHTPAGVADVSASPGRGRHGDSEQVQAGGDRPPACRPRHGPQGHDRGRREDRASGTGRPASAGAGDGDRRRSAAG